MERSKHFIIISLMPGYRKRVFQNLSMPTQRLPTEIGRLISILVRETALSESVRLSRLARIERVAHPIS